LGKLLPPPEAACIAATVAFSSVVLACATGFLFEEATNTRQIQTEKFICSFSLVACQHLNNEEKEGGLAYSSIGKRLMDLVV